VIHTTVSNGGLILVQNLKIPPSPPAGGFGRAGKYQNDSSKIKK